MSSCKPLTSNPRTLPLITAGECGALAPLPTASYCPRLSAPLPSAPSIACLLALNRHQDCLSLITREVKQGRATADVYILRARIYNFFQKVVHSGQGRCVAPSVLKDYRGGKASWKSYSWGPCLLR